MTSDEKLLLIKRYLLYVDTFVYHEYKSIRHTVHHKSEQTPEDVLKVYRARVRYESFKEFSSDLEKLLYDNYRGV